MAEYIRIPAIYNKIRNAEEEYRPLYISGMTGFGKTAAVKNYLKRRAYEYISGENGQLPKMPDPETMRAGVLVIDDISWITDEKSQNYIKRVLFRKDLWVILIGRSKLPNWLSMVDMEVNLLRANERDLVFSEKEVNELFEKNGIKLGNEMIRYITEVSFGYAVCILLMMKRILLGETLGDDLVSRARDDMFHYCDEAFYNKWDSNLREVLLAVCEYDTFNLEMAKELTRKENVAEILEYADNVGSFLRHYEGGELGFLTFLHRYLKWKKTFIYKKEDNEINFLRAAVYYESHGEVVFAAKFYKKAGRDDKLRNILIENAKLHPGKGHYFDLRRYYLELPEEEIEKSPLLMAAMSMLYSIMMMPEESDSWYEKLLEFSRSDLIEDKKLKKEALSRVAYLNLALPHRGVKNIMDSIKDTALLSLSKEVSLPELSLTDNLPSLMNGGLDYSEWSKVDKEIALALKKPVELILGKSGKGLVNIALAESGFEKGTMDEYEITNKLNQGILMSEAGGDMAIGFAATGVMIRQLVLHGNVSMARKNLESFEKKARNEKEVRLYKNMTVLSIWLSLLEGDTIKASEWLKTSPDEAEEFCILRRYSYIQKVRILIALERYTEALTLIERLDYYFTIYDRNILWIENQLLKAIVYSRLKFAQWKGILENALKRAAEYHFVNIIAFEGAAIKPLMDNTNKLSGDAEFDKEIVKLVNQVARYYPMYLNNKKDEIEPLTDKEKEIVKLMLSGATSEEICNQCSITYNSLKFHNKNIYKKLGVKNRQEAERKASTLNL